LRNAFRTRFKNRFAVQLGAGHCLNISELGPQCNNAAPQPNNKSLNHTADSKVVLEDYSSSQITEANILLLESCCCSGIPEPPNPQPTGRPTWPRTWKDLTEASDWKWKLYSNVIAEMSALLLRSRHCPLNSEQNRKTPPAQRNFTTQRAAVEPSPAMKDQMVACHSNKYFIQTNSAVAKAPPLFWGKIERANPLSTKKLHLNN
jgi:hypothetical protein